MTELTEMQRKRELGDGRWDMKLKAEMVRLSKADTYNGAKQEWIATGNVWWRTLGEQPDWVQRVQYCMCGHHITYHFEIHNTETDVRRAVGSDHINSYLILRAISEATGLESNAITEEMIEEWITVRVEALKTTAWWNVNGEDFTEMFDDIKELDLRLNVREKKGKYRYDEQLRASVPITSIRKKGVGSFGDPDYEMASIVWRWNHPDNTRAQINGRGYPNDKLWSDLIMFWAFIEEHKEKVAKDDEMVAKRIEELNDLDAKLQVKRQAMIGKNALLRSARKEKDDTKFNTICDYFGFRVFSEDDGTNDWERNFLHDMRIRLTRGNEPSERQTQTLNKIVKRNDKPASEAQKSYVKALGWEGRETDIPDTNRAISILIDKLKENNEENNEERG